MANVWGVIGRLLRWHQASAPESGAQIQTDGAGDTDAGNVETREEIEQCALPGFYGIVATGDEVLVVTRDDGGIAIAARTTRPGDAVAGERGFTNGTVIARIKYTGGNHIFEITGADEVHINGNAHLVVRDGDAVAVAASLLNHTHTETGAQTSGPCTAGGVPWTGTETVGNVVASTATVFAGD